MKAAPFEYTRAPGIGEACELLARLGRDAKVIAGGQSLVPMMAMRLVRPTWLIDINQIDALKFIVLEIGRARVGACTRQVTVERDDALAARVPLLRKALAWVGHIQTRNRGTIGGSLVHADPSAELPLVAQVLEASLLLRSTNGEHLMTAREFFTGAMSTAARPVECLQEIHWPIWSGRTGSAFTELSIRHGDFAIVAAAAQVTMDGEGRCTRAAFGLAGVGGVAIAFPALAQRLIGSRLESKLVRDTAEAAANQCEPGSDLHASADYRRHLARVLTERVLTAAREEALAT